MEPSPNPAASPRLHPLLWVAGIAVTLLSLTGIAALTGLLPSKSAPEVPVVVAAQAAEPTTPAAVPAPAPSPAVAPAPTQEVPAAKAPPASPRKPATKKVERKADPDVAARPVAFPPPPASGVPPDYVPPAAALAEPPMPAAPPPCPDCGVIADVRQVTREAPTSGAGAIIGGLAGGALANNIGRGNTRTLATIAGAVGGGVIGNSIEKSQRRTTGYQVTVRMEDGNSRMIPSETMPSWRIGDRVRLAGGNIVPR